MSKNKNTLLWEISGRGIKSPSYFFGTMHVRDKRAFRGIDFLTDCIDSCDSFAAEFNLQDADYHKLNSAAKIPDNKSLNDFLNPRVYAKLDKILKRETGANLDDFRFSSPILLFNVISEAQFNSDNNLALDSALYSMAEKMNKIMLGLETFDAQISVFSKVDIKEQCRSLKGLATNFRKFRREINKSAELYIQGDLQKLVANTKKTIGSMRRILLYERNVTMANNFIDIASQHSLFAAVGAGHFGGQKGVLRLLKLKGCKLQPVFY